MTTTPFLGCKISLISKSEIRYEGILYTIDPKESTIALAKVRSFGTEDRPCERPVAPRDEVFEYIIFRAADIKDLIVDDPPSSLTGLTDPAIIQAHSVSSAPNFPGTTITATNTVAGSQRPPSGQMTFPSGATINASQPSTGSTGIPLIGAAASVGSRSESTPTPNAQQQKSSSPLGQQAQNRPDRQVQRPAQVRAGGDVRNRPSGRFDRQDNRRPPMMNYRDNRQQQQNRPQSNWIPPRNFSGPPGRQAGYGQNFNRDYNRGPPQFRQQNRMGGPNRMGNRNDRAKEKEKYDTEFDFEKALKEFENLEVSEKTTSTAAPADQNGEKEAEKEGEEKTEPKYNKEKSFFDMISCEALEREQGKSTGIDWRKERKINIETFGVANPRRTYRGRGGHYGGPRNMQNRRNYNQPRQHQNQGPKEHRDKSKDRPVGATSAWGK